MNTQHDPSRAATLAALHRQVSLFDNAIRIAQRDVSLAPGVPPVSLQMRRDRARAELAAYQRSIRGEA